MKFRHAAALAALALAHHTAGAQCPIVETGRLYLSNVPPNQFSGSAVACSANLAVIGLPENAGNGFTPAGSVAVFEWTGQAWVEAARLHPPISPQQGFGAAVAIDGDTIAVGNPGIAKVFIFTRVGAAWTLAQTIDDPIPAPLTRFGREVALDGDTLVACSPYSDSGSIRFAGSAHVFRRTAGAFAHEATLTSPSPGTNDFFGSSVAADNGAVLVGCYGDSLLGATAGAGFLFRAPSWKLEAALRAPDSAGADALGFSCDLSGDTAVLGAPFDDTPLGQDAGSARVFIRKGSQWMQQAALLGPAAGARFGNAVALDDNTLLVAPINSSAVPVFTRAGALWTSSTSLAPDPPGYILGFGNALAVKGSTALVGAPNSTVLGRTQAGVTLAYDLAPAAPSIISHPASVNTAPGQPVSFTVQVAAPTPCTYQWRLNGTPIPSFPPFSGTTTPTLNIATATPLHAGAFDVVITTFCGVLTSNPATLDITLPCPADLTTTAIPGSPGYGMPNGILTNDDFFYYLALFAAGC